MAVWRKRSEEEAEVGSRNSKKGMQNEGFSSTMDSSSERRIFVTHTYGIFYVPDRSDTNNEKNY